MLYLAENIIHSEEEESLPINLSDALTFNKIYHKLQPVIFYTAYGLLKNQQEAEEVAAESFVKLWKAEGKFQNTAAIISWLRLTTRNSCLNLLKHKKYEDSKFSDIIALGNSENMDVLLHEEILADLLTDIYTKIEGLPRKQREIFKLRYINGLSNEKIAEHLGIKNQSVRDHLVRGIKTIRLLLLSKGLVSGWLLFLLSKIIGSFWSSIALLN